MKREPLLTQGYFDQAVAYEAKKIPEMKEKLAAAKGPALNRARYGHSILQKRRELPILLYSQGASRESVRSAFMDMIPEWESYNLLAREAYEEKDRPTRPTFTSSIDDYVLGLWAISFAYIFEIDQPSLVHLAKLIDGEGKACNEGIDALYEALLAQRVKNRKTAMQLVYPNPYQPLYDLISARAEERVILMRKFLSSWYKNMKTAWWYDNHKGPDGGGFFGYWAIEAAGVVKAFGVSDQDFRDLPYYPKDLF